MRLAKLLDFWRVGRAHKHIRSHRAFLLCTPLQAAGLSLGGSERAGDREGKSAQGRRATSAAIGRGASATYISCYRAASGFVSLLLLFTLV